MRRTNAESPDTFTAKLGFFDRTFAPHTDRLGVSCRVQAKALIQRTFDRRVGDLPPSENGGRDPRLKTCSGTAVRAMGC